MIVNVAAPATPLNSESSLHFWGVRGKIPTPERYYLHYGGNTSCVEMSLGDHRFIFDGGTGLRSLGNHLLKKMPVEAHLLFTHCHWDRIQGFPFFIPAFIPGNTFHIYGANASNGATFQERLENQMLGPNFPVPMNIMQAKLNFQPLHPQSTYQMEEVTVATFLLQPLHQSLAYRLTYGSQQVVYATDTNGLPSETWQAFLHFLTGTQVLIIDSPASSNGETTLEDWGDLMGSLQQVSNMKVIVSAHAPDYQDDYLQGMEQQLQSRFPDFCFAREGMTIPLS